MFMELDAHTRHRKVPSGCGGGSSSGTASSFFVVVGFLDFTSLLD